MSPRGQNPPVRADNFAPSESVRAPRAGAFSRTHNHTLNQPTPTHPTSTADGVGGAEELVRVLVGKGVAAPNAQSLVAEHPGERIRMAVDWFDEQPGSKTPGLLVHGVREGRAPTRRSASADPRVAREWRLKLDAFAAWCHEHLPESCGPELHLGAFQAFFRLGSPSADRLSVAEHLPVVRGFVEKWDRELRITPPSLPERSTT